MATYLALLRGVNVGSNKVIMADLRALFTELGHADARTHLQTGNVVFTADTGDRAKLAATIADAIESAMAVTTTVLLRTRDELAALIAADPYGAQGIDPARRYVTFLDSAPAPGLVAALDPAYGAPDEFTVGDRAVYVHCPNGYGRTKLSNAFFERRLKVPATSRGFRVTAKLLDLLDAEPG
ncbi:MAG TPA: DUF1697 domain-containing protein [Streptosporangiaceae bacterium]|jgi:uncharacterized protein (DUF1697 family)